MDLARLYTLVRQLQAALGGRRTRGGQGSVTWPGGSPNSSSSTIPHGLGVVPNDVEFANVGTTNMVLMVASSDATNIVVSATTRDGTSPAAATQRSFYWRAWA